MSDVLETRPPAHGFGAGICGPAAVAAVRGGNRRARSAPEALRAGAAAGVRRVRALSRAVLSRQSLTKDEQIAFSEQFGTLERHIARNRGSDNPWVHTVSNLGADGRPSGKVNSTAWHTDKSFRPEPSLATILHAVTMPPNGGDTCFANMYAAYEALSDEDKRALDGLRVIHSWELSREKQGQKATPEEIRDAPPMSHPLVRVHPDTGRKCLFMGEHASHIEGRPIEEGRGLAGPARSARDRRSGSSIATAGVRAIC